MRYFLDSKNVNYKEEFEPEHSYIFSGRCIISKKEVTVRVKSQDLYEYNRGALIQTAFPYLTPEEREWLMTGIFEFPEIDGENE